MPMPAEPEPAPTPLYEMFGKIVHTEMPNMEMQAQPRLLRDRPPVTIVSIETLLNGR